MEKRIELDLTRQDHQFLVGCLSMMIDKFGYGPRELYQLIEDSKKDLFFTFMEMHKENKEKAGK